MSKILNHILVLHGTLLIGLASAACSGAAPEDMEEAVEYGELEQELLGINLGSLPGSNIVNLDQTVTDVTDRADEIIQNAGSALDPSGLLGSTGLPLPQITNPLNGGLDLPDLSNLPGELTTTLDGVTGSATQTVTDLTTTLDSTLGSLPGASALGSLPVIGTAVSGGTTGLLGSGTGLIGTATGTIGSVTGALPLPGILSGGTTPAASLSCDMLTECGGACTNLTSDPDNCGACGNACDASKVCQAGACVNSCLPLFTDCGGSCVSTLTDTANCGGCGNACSAGQICSAGICLL